MELVEPREERLAAVIAAVWLAGPAERKPVPQTLRKNKEKLGFVVRTYLRTGREQKKEEATSKSLIYPTHSPNKQACLIGNIISAAHI